MKVTKYPQSCLLIEKGGTRIVIDPGSFFAAQHGIEELGSLDAVLYSHQHTDHFDKELVRGFSAMKVPIYANESVCELIEGEATTVSDQQEFVIGEFSIQTREIPHFDLPDGSPGPQNTGYIIDNTFFDPGDSLDGQGITVPDAAVPIAGPSISIKDSLDFIKQIGAKRAIPIHYDFFTENPELLNTFNYFENVEIIVLEDGEFVEL